MRFVALVLLLGGCDALLDFDKLRHGHGDGGTVTGDDGGAMGGDGGGMGGDGGSACKTPANGPFFDFANPTVKALGQYAYAMQLADLDGDGRPELVTLEGDNNVRAYSVSAARAITPILTMGAGCSAFNENGALAVGDLDGDKLIDLVPGCANTLDMPQTDLDFLQGTSAGHFASAQSYATPPSNPYAMIARDLDGDGVPDLAVVDTKAPAGVDVYFSSTRTGTAFAITPVRIAVTSGTPLSILAAPLGAPGDAVLDLLVLTVDLDTSAGHVEIFRRDRTAGMKTHFITGTGEKVSLTEGDPSAIGIGNFDTDGRPDLLIADDGGALYVAPGAAGTGGVTSYATPTMSVVTPAYSYQLAVGDLNCDGLDDVVLTHDPLNSAPDEDAYEVWTSSADTLSVVGTPVDTVEEGQPNTSFVQIGDLDGDGLADVVMTIDGRLDTTPYSSFRILFGLPKSP